MKEWLVPFTLAILVGASGLAARPRQEVVNFDQKLSINVEDISLGRLLRLWDQATGMQSSIPPELSDLPVSLSFSGLSVNDSVRKIFEKLPVDYVFIDGQGIIVTSASQAAALEEPALIYEEEEPQVSEDQTAKESPKVIVEQPRLPPIMPTPFGPMVYNGNPVIQLPPIPGEVPPPPFFQPMWPLPAPPAGAANGPVYNNLFSPISIYQNNPGLPPLRP